ncbi:ATP-binding protein [Actinomadura sp. PM05-2]|uniref:ATP-binding protein n=2 Tax=Actinomadura parmotrematis TaxID=2864039 RepID=A0ABS7FVX0_9ACTN|nr:ATP-binding protein [Actinomadura parmotrematis]
MIAATPESIKSARDFVGRWFYDHGLDQTSIDLAETVATELVTNAYRHAAMPGEGIIVRLFVSDAGPVLEVWDRSEIKPEVRSPNAESTSGRGLMMVEAMTPMWGCIPLASGGKAVWAVLHAERADEECPA